MGRRVVVRAPASSANLGPGFDVLAAALTLHVELEVEETGTFSVVTDLEIARDRRNLCVRAFERLHPPDAFTFTIRSDIPLAGGLGSSAAAIVAGLMAARDLFGLDADLLALASEMEGHPDNAAASLHGGFQICAGGRAAGLAPPRGLEAVAVVPGEVLRTRTARAALPAEVPLTEAAFNVGHAALLILGLARGEWDLVARGLHDRLHQPRRAALYPRSMELIDQARSLGALGATISGAGPSVLVWLESERAGAVIEALEHVTEGWAEVLRVPFEAHGAQVR
ncbi:MAG: homoserine kinase, partial [Actinomycetota bacterium]|nr:homoserine kinase [Actinomycetota bacterium]